MTAQVEHTTEADQWTGFFINEAGVYLKTREGYETFVPWIAANGLIIQLLSQEAGQTEYSCLSDGEQPMDDVISNAFDHYANYLVPLDPPAVTFKKEKDRESIRITAGGCYVGHILPYHDPDDWVHDWSVEIGGFNCQFRTKREAKRFVRSYIQCRTAEGKLQETLS